MVDQQRAAMREAISTLVKARARIVNRGGSGWKLEAQRCINAITALNEALAQPQDMKECRHCGWLCKPNDVPSKKGYVLAQPQESTRTNNEETNMQNYEELVSTPSTDALNADYWCAGCNPDNCSGCKIPNDAQPQDKQSELHRVVSDHIVDLRGCIPTLMEYPEMASTMREVEKAANELEAALVTDKRMAQPQDCKECGAKQAKIDSLMLEYCPDEITDEQMAEWAKYQTPVQECRHCGWLCKPNPNNQKFLEALRGIK